MEIRSKKGNLIVIDAGTGIRKLGNKLVHEKNLSMTMLFTHAHWDHLMGFPFFKPIFKKGMKITILSNKFNKPSVKTLFNGLMDRPFFPVQLSDKDIHASLAFKSIPQKPFTIGTITIHPINLSHPKDGGTGFRFEEDGKSFVFLTDNELGYVHKGGRTFEEYRTFCKDADLLIHDAEYEDKEYQKILKYSEEPWGHSILSDVIRLGIGARVARLGLFHLNAMRTDRKVDAMVKKARSAIVKKNTTMKCFAVGSSFEIIL
jgi:phosphoribosyl 1,2-cyclic phosphodiesterase